MLAHLLYWTAFFSCLFFMPVFLFYFLDNFLNFILRLFYWISFTIFATFWISKPFSITLKVRWLWRSHLSYKVERDLATSGGMWEMDLLVLASSFVIMLRVCLLEKYSLNIQVFFVSTYNNSLAGYTILHCINFFSEFWRPGSTI